MSLREVLSAFLLACSLGAASASEMVFKLVGNGGNCAGCEWVSAEGEITRDSYKRFAEFSKGKLTPTVYFDSPGGSLAGGLLLGETLRKLDVATGIGKTVAQIDGRSHELKPGSCLSACAFAFMGGKARNIPVGSRLGVHQFYNAIAMTRPQEKVFSAIDVSNDQIVTGLILEFVMRMGVDANVVQLASKTAPADMYVLSAAEADALKVAWQPNALKTWHVEPYRRGLVAYARSQDEHSQLTLFCEKRSRKLLYTTSEAVGIAQDSGAITFLGADIERKDVAITQSSAGTSMLFPLPKDFTPSINQSSNVLSNVNSTPHVGWFQIGFEANGLQEAARLAFKNCI